METNAVQGMAKVAREPTQCSAIKQRISTEATILNKVHAGKKTIEV